MEQQRVYNVVTVPVYNVVDPPPPTDVPVRVTL